MSDEAGARVSVLEDSSENGKHYKAGDEGFCTGPSSMGIGRVEIIFDTGHIANPPRSRIQIVFKVGTKVRTNCDSSDDGRYYKEGDVGIFMGPSSYGAGRASVKFDRTGKIENPHSQNLQVLSNEPVRQVLLMRHGQAEHNVNSNATESVIDPLLTAVGQAQASSWSDGVAQFGAELVLVSPLRRAVQTACLVFQHDAAPLRLCRPAREVGWHKCANQLGAVEQLEELLDQLPGGIFICAEQSLPTEEEEAQSEQASLTQLQQILTAGLSSSVRTETPPSDPNTAASKEEAVVSLNQDISSSEPKHMFIGGDDGGQEAVILVVTHYGTIKALCGVETMHCEVIQCVLRESGHLEAVARHPPPWVSIWQGFRVRVSQSENDEDSQPDGDGFCMGPSDRDANRVKVVFDDAIVAHPCKSRVHVVLAVGSRVAANHESSDNGRYYRVGDIGTFLGPSDFGDGRANVLFERTGKVENPHCLKLEPHGH